MPVLGRPFVDWQLETLAAAGVTEVVLLVGHSGDHIRDHVGSGDQFGLAVTYVEDGPDAARHRRRDPAQRCRRLPRASG